MAEQTFQDKDRAASALTEDDPRPGDETAADQAEASNAAPRIEDADAALQTLQRERDELQDRLLRTAAEFQNYRNRVDRERRELIESAASDVLAELLPIVDNFERALQAPSTPGAEAFRKGAELIHRQMLDLLRKRRVTPIEALGADFDPRYHQAVIHEPSDEHREGEVMEELQRGYMLGDRLLRPAMVKVAKRS
jgi:molecular chaperone GrpE